MVSKRLRTALRTKPKGYTEYTGADRLSLRRTAYHEAAHAVVDVVLGIRFTWVVATKTAGWVDVTNPCAAWQRGDGSRSALARDWAVSMYAGAAGEEALGEGVGRWYNDFDSAEDWLARCCRPRGAAFVGDAAYDRQEAALRSRSRLMVSSYWKAIEATAEALLKVSALEEHEVMAIVDGGKPPSK